MQSYHKGHLDKFICNARDQSQNDRRFPIVSAPAIAVDMGGSHITCAAVRDRQILYSRSFEVDGESFNGVLTRLESEIRSVLDHATITPAECMGVAIGFCGIVDSKQNTVLATNAKFEGSCGFDFRAWALRSFGLRLRMENDARMALLGENFAGAARSYEDIVMITLGTGIGGVAMLQGKLLHSHNGRAGVIGGHLPVVIGGRVCTCGNVGCAEAEASTWALPIICREWPGFAKSSLAREDRIDFRTLFVHVDAGDLVAKAVLNHCIRVWSVLTVALIHAYGPQIVVFGGGVLHRVADILPHVRSYVDKYAWISGEPLPVVEAQLSSSAALYGAIPLLCEEHL